ncbi:acyltransferase family protein [Pseudomonas aeruginosa]
MLGYRAEVDGLRAIAVSSVLLFHAGFSFIPGGFVGVDVFFVISGYLITSIILREMEVGKFSFAKFYERRAKRLLPPLLPVLCASIIVSFALLDSDLLKEFATSVYSAVGFVSNWYFLQSVSYFGGPGEQTPLLHLWSLSIEEQFYFLFPAILLIVFLVGRRFIFPVLMSLLLMSALYSFYLIFKYDIDSAFYNSVARSWELLVGAVLAVKPNWRAVGKVPANFVEILGLGMIVVAMACYSHTIAFPGLSAAVPVLGAALIISAGGNGSIVSPLLKSRPFVSLGLISYALYLWHWPILVFVRIVNPGVGAAGMALSLCGAIILAVMSYYLIERPIRTKSGLRAAHVATASALSLLFVVFFSAIVTSDRLSDFHDKMFAEIRRSMYPGGRSDMIARIEKESNRYLIDLNVNFNGQSGVYKADKYAGWTCSYDKGNTIDRIYECLVSQAKDNNVLVMGDSIGRDTTHALRRAFPEANFIMLHQSSCPPGDANACFNGMADLLERLSISVKVNAVILNFRYMPSNWAAVSNGIDEAKKLSKNVILMGVSPFFSMTFVDFIKSIPSSSEIPLFIDNRNTDLTRWSYTDLANQARQMALSKNIYFVNVLDFFCPQKKCRLWVDNRYGDPLIFDQQHLTNNGISEFSEYLKRQSIIYNHI